MTPELRALLRKELIDVRRNASALLPVGFAAVMALVLPFIIALAIPSLTGESLGDDTDLVKMGRATANAAGLDDAGVVQLFLFQQFLLFFLLMPITGAMALAAHSIVGEKQARTLEPLLATPLRTLDLLVAKVLGALLPTLALTAAAMLVFFGGVALLARPGVAVALLNPRTAVLVLLLGPAAALVSLQAALLVSSRVNDARTAQQFGVILILPLTAIFVGQLSGAIWLSAAALAGIAAALGGVWGLLALVSVMVFDRDTVLTRWR
jgi:ABC-2 type transport system permease protein